MKKAFTLLELLVVIAIMAMLGGASVTGYRAAAQGMKDKAALNVVQTLVDLAQQRAEIDRKPVFIYLYDDYLQKADESKGHDLKGSGVAVAVRPAGRITAIDGNLLYDEFGDLDMSYSEENPDEEEATQTSGSQKTQVKFYLMNSDSGDTFFVAPSVVSQPIQEVYLVTGTSTENTNESSGSGSKEIPAYAYRQVSGTKPNVGDAYGKEFGPTVRLPNGYFFGASAPTQIGRKQIGNPIAIDAKGSGAKNITVYRMKPSGNGTVKVGTTEKAN